MGLLAVIVGLGILAWAVCLGRLVRTPRESEMETELDGDHFLAESGMRTRKGL